MKYGTTKKEWHYGYRAHIIGDAKYGLPIHWKVTTANNSEQIELDNMIKDMASSEEKYKLEKMINLMADAGYDKENKALRYGRYTKGKKVYRVPLSTDQRIFTPVARDSKKFKTKYKMRTEVGRLNGRIDRDYMFNDHFIRGQKKMEIMLDKRQLDRKKTIIQSCSYIKKAKYFYIQRKKNSHRHIFVS